jgi:structural maintenance of chromosome 2
LIRKKDIKLQEIEKILSEEVNPQLETLRKEKDDFALFKSNESTIEEHEKLLTAYDYYENEKFSLQAPTKNREFEEKIKKLNTEFLVK